jgi:hypothetical protein
MLIARLFVRVCKVVAVPLDKIWGVVDRILALMDMYICLPTEQRFIEHYDDTQVWWLYQHSRDSRAVVYGTTDLDLAWRKAVGDMSKKSARLWARLDHKFQIWKKMAGDDWQKKVEGIRVRIVLAEKERERIEHERYVAMNKAREDAAVSRRKMLSVIVQYTRHIAPVAVAIVIGLLCYIIAGALMVIVPSIVKAVIIVVRFLFLTCPVWLYHYTMAFGALCSMGEIVTLIATPALGVVLIGLNNKCDLEVPFVHAGKAIFAVMEYITRPVAALGRGIGAVAMFFIEYIKLFKQNNCPHINWID